MGKGNIHPGENTFPLNPLARGPHELIEDQSACTPDASALVMGSEQLTHGQVNARANRLARFLVAQSIGPGNIVGVYLDRSFDSIIALLALLKCGATYLPLDPKFPMSRLEFMAEDSGASLLLAHASRQETLPRTSARVVLLDSEVASIAAHSSENLNLPGQPEQIAYLLYTSGSTGKPKGVMIPRGALTNFLLSMAETPGMSAHDTLLSITPSSFDISILEFLLPLVCGARTVMATAQQAADGRALADLLRLHNATVMQATPATWRMLLESQWEGKSDLRILSGGEAMTADLARQLLPRCLELWNMYGPTETTIWSSLDLVTSPDKISLGMPIARTTFQVFDEKRNPVAAGEPGELWIGGTGLALGYLNRPDLTAERFVPDPAAPADHPNARLYRTGDEVRYRADGTLEFLGRLDHQVKLNGFRIELGEIESALASIEGITQAVVILREDRPDEKRLVAYYTGNAALSPTALIQSLKATLPGYMVPAAFVHMEQFPLTPNSKLDRKALPTPSHQRPQLSQEFVAPRTPVEKQLAALWCHLLQLDQVGIDDSFFELGGNSLGVVRMVTQYHARFGNEISAIRVFQFPTISKLAASLDAATPQADFLAQASQRASRRRSQNGVSSTREPVAIVGMSGRFPGAANLDQLWQNLCNAVESISFFTPEELSPDIDENLRRDPDYVRARGLIDGADLFDAAFFGISPLEAKVMDPQQRVFLELVQQALENAAVDPERYPGRIGVFAGLGDNHYYTTNLLTHPDLLAMAGKLAVEYGNQKDYIALRAAYLLDLRGPAVSVNTACSTTLLTVDQACRSLLDYECDVALSGGVDITVPQKSGFLYQEGGTFCRDGHCRPFDAEATGTMFSDGAGVVVLKRLSDALKDGDRIYALVRGSGKNNNGARPASFLAPSVDGQAEVIAIAQADADVPVESIGYIEAHGTGTPVGDPIEFEALRKVFECKTEKKQFCYLGSIKGNIGHPTNAAGVAGLIKAALVLYHEQIPPTLHFKTPNPRIDFASSPFVVADKLIPFPRATEPRRAAVSSFGFGGTNVHVILEEGPQPRPETPTRPRQLIMLSARTESALNEYARNAAEHFAHAAPDDFADAAFTLQTGRRQMANRRFVVAADPAEAAQLLAQSNPLRSARKRCDRRNPDLVFLFGGQGTQYVNMGLNLYRDEPLFRAIVDDCCERLRPHLGRDLRELLFPAPGDEKTAQTALQDTFYTQPAIFVVEYALARLWQSFGVQPAIMTGHSIGEFVAATLAGVWQLEDVLSIVALRGRLMQSLPRGSMMAVSRGVDAIASILPPALQIASNNAPNLCVVSGPEPEIRAFQSRLESEQVVCRFLHTSHAFHSAMMDPIVEPLRQAIAALPLHVPQIPIVSTVTGLPITAGQATDPAYWAGHARATVQFAKAIAYLKEQGRDLFLECGPRSTMCSLARQQFTAGHPCTAIPSLADTADNDAEWTTLLFALGSLWLNGVSISWDAFYAHEERRHIPLPTYPFERQRYWVDPAVTVAPTHATLAPYLEPEPVVIALINAEAGSAPASRRDRIAARLIDLLVPVSGRDRSQISTTATFMEQGLDSLSLTQVAIALRREFAVKVSFTQLMNQLPNIDLLAAHLDAELPAEVLAVAPVAAQPSAPATPQSVDSTIPQRGIFNSSSFSDHLSASYNESMTLRFTGTISVEKMQLALDRLYARHDALRATFDASGRTMQLAPAQPFAVPVTDLSAVPTAAQEELLRELLAEETARPFPLPAGPLFRAQIITFAADRAAVVLTAHHVICDGWSLDVLIHDLCAFYSGELSGQPASLPPADSYLEYARLVTERERSDSFEQDCRWWHEKFSGGFPTLVLPTDHPRPARRQFRARRIDTAVSASIVQDLRATAAQQGCSFFAALLGSLAVLFARVSRQRRFVLALPTAEQPVLGQPGLAGHCVNLLPVAVELREGESISDFLKRVQTDLIAAQDHSGFTLVSLLEDLRPLSQSPGLSPIAAGFTNIKKFKPGELPLSGFSISYDANPKAFESFELYLNAVEDGDNLDLHCHFDVALFDELTIREWLAALASILRDVAANPARSILDLARLDAADSAPEVLYAPVSSLEATQNSLRDLTVSAAPSDLSESDLLRALLPLWRQILHVRTIGPDEDFFALGGHSVAAAQLFALIQRTLGCTAPLATLYTASTPRQLAHVLSRGARAEDWNALVPINSSGSRPPLFLIHAAEGNVLLYRALAAHLGTDQPVYGLQSAGLDGHTAINASFEHVARSYVAEIRRVQPQGPYLLGGYCLGGTIALEMARQLLDAGEPVGLVALIEDFNIRSVRWPLSLRHRLLNRFVLNPWYHIENMFAAEGSAKIDFFREKFRVELRRARLSARILWQNLRRRVLRNEDAPLPHVMLAELYDEALARYEIHPYPGELTLFLAQRHLAGMDDPLGGWTGIAQAGLHLYTLPISPRGSLVEPFVRQLAAHLRACIDRANATSEPSVSDSEDILAGRRS
jgi:amino acid adenylation domain-containing protein